MGNDGGSIPTRRELVKEAAKQPSAIQVKEAQREHLEHYWTTCPLSHKPLTRPIVSDAVGSLYNKDAILTYLLPSAIEASNTNGNTANNHEKEGISSMADCDEILRGRVKGLRDVVEVIFEVDTTPADDPSNSKSKQSSLSSSSPSSSADRKGIERWICPVTRKELGPNVKAVYLVPCGHVFAEEAIREMKGDTCLQCNEPYIQDNVIPILPTKESDKQRLISRIQKLVEQSLTHSLKKAPGSKKRKKHATTTNGEEGSNATATATATATTSSISMANPSASTLAPPKSSTTTSGIRSGIRNTATALLTARILEEEGVKKKRQKMVGPSENLRSLFTSDADRKQIKDGDFMTRGYTIPANARRE